MLKLCQVIANYLQSKFNKNLQHINDVGNSIAPAIELFKNKRFQ